MRKSDQLRPFKKQSKIAFVFPRYRKIGSLDTSSIIEFSIMHLCKIMSMLYQEIEKRKDKMYYLCYSPISI